VHLRVVDKFYIRCSVHRDSRLKKSNEMQHYVHIYSLIKLLVILSVNKYLHTVASRWISSTLHIVGSIKRTHDTYL